MTVIFHVTEILNMQEIHLNKNNYQNQKKKKVSEIDIENWEF